MNRKVKLFVATIQDGEMFFLLDEFAGYYADRSNDGEECEYQIEQWEAGYIMENNSLWKDEDEDFYHEPLQLWNTLQEQVAWQRRRGVVNFESARRLILEDAAEMRVARMARKNIAHVLP